MVRHLKLLDENPGEEPGPTFITTTATNSILLMKKHAIRNTMETKEPKMVLKMKCHKIVQSYHIHVKKTQ